MREFADWRPSREPVRAEIEMVQTTKRHRVVASQKEYAVVQKSAQQFEMFGSLWAGAMLATDLMPHVGELSDVTAAQVKESRAEYRKANDALAPFKRILDVHTSRWFGNEPNKAQIKSGSSQTCKRWRRPH